MKTCKALGTIRRYMVSARYICLSLEPCSGKKKLKLNRLKHDFYSLLLKQKTKCLRQVVFHLGGKVFKSAINCLDGVLYRKKMTSAVICLKD